MLVKNSSTPPVGAVAIYTYSYSQYNQMNTLLVTLDNLQKCASDGRVALQGIFKALLQAHPTLAFVYMKYVVRLPLKCMGHSERERAFMMLGACLQFLDNGVYEKTFLKDRIQNFLVKRKAMRTRRVWLL
jgi:hypothetical protein